jgi:hypothetical protein
VALPSLAEGSNHRQRPQVRECLRRVQSVEELEAIFASYLGIGVAAGLALRQARILDPLAVALIPRERRHRLEPGGSDGRQFVERGPEGFDH